jgi:hypothetical protein
MKTFACWAGVLGVLLAALGADGARTPSIRAVMHKQYRVTRAPFVLIKKELGAPAPDWEKVAQAADEFASLAAILEKNEPKWGDKESWLRFTTAHVNDAKALAAAAQGHDREALQTVRRRIETACNACHVAHRQAPRD